MIDLPDARELTQPLHDLMINAHKAAVKQWEKLLTERPDFGLPLDTTTRANYIHAHLVYEIKQRVEGIPDVTPTEDLGFFALRVGSDILLRFKYVGHGRPHNVGTKQQRHLARQAYTGQMMLTLTGDPGLTPPTLITVGYTLDGSELARIEIRRDCKNHLPWRFDIYGGTELIQPIVLDGLADTAKPAIVTSTRTKRAENEAQAEQG